jgi:hypothetical protein
MALEKKTLRRLLRSLLLVAALYIARPLPGVAAAPLLTDTPAMHAAAPEAAGEAAVVMLAAPLPVAAPLSTPLVWSIAIMALLLFYHVARLVVERQRRELEQLRHL